MPASRVRTIVEIGLTIALSAVLGLIAVVQLPQGGSYSLVMLPIFVLALLRGPAIGISAGALYGIVDYMLKPYYFHPLQVVLDYPIAFAAVGLAGLFAARWHAMMAEHRTGAAISTALLPGVALGALGRYAAHVLSGLVFFASYAPENQSPLVYSALYNSFVLVSAVVSAIVLISILPPLENLVGARRR